MRNAFLSHVDAALRNRNSLLHYVRYNEGVSRTDIWENMNISRASVTQIIRQLQDCGLIREVREGQSTGGRKPTYLVFNGEKLKLYVFDWAHKALYLTDLNGRILHEETMAFEKHIRPDAFAQLLLERIRQTDGLALTRSMAVEYGGFNIRTNCICPAAIQTPMVGESNLGDPNFDDDFFRTRLTPIHRWGRPEEIANTALFLATDGSYMNGAVLVLDGGITVNGNVNKTPFA